MNGLAPSKRPSVAVYLIGGAGNVATAIVAGCSALAQGATTTAGLVTAGDAFADLDLVGPASLVFGGCDVDRRDPTVVLQTLIDDGCIDAALAGPSRGVLSSYGKALHDGQGRPGAFDLDLCEAQLRSFRDESGAERLVVVNVASTEASFDGSAIATEVECVAAARSGQLPPSAGYALAATRVGAAHINFTPSTGCRVPAIEELSRERGTVLTGRDGKTGQTLLKSALLPLFAGRNLRVLSWFSQNILGNRDGQHLQQAGSLSAKQRSKSEAVSHVLGYEPDGQVNIDYVPALGDWKIAWDHVLFSGFLGTRMSLELSWRGADTILAAPLVLDLVRLVDLALRRGESGRIGELAYFFKDPLGLDEHRLEPQFQLLVEYARRNP